MNQRKQEIENEKEEVMGLKKGWKAGLMLLSFILCFVLGITGILSICSLSFCTDGFLKKDQKIQQEPDVLFSAFTNNDAIYYEGESGDELLPYSIRNNALSCKIEYETKKNNLNDALFHLSYYNPDENGQMIFSGDSDGYVDDNSASGSDNGKIDDSTMVDNNITFPATFNFVSMNKLLTLFEDSVRKSIDESGNNTEVYDVYGLTTKEARKYTDFLVLSRQQYVNIIQNYGETYADFRQRKGDADTPLKLIVNLSDDSFIYEYSDEYTAVTKYVIYSPEGEECKFLYFDGASNWSQFYVKDISKLLFPTELVGDGEDQAIRDQKILVTPFCGFASLGSAYVKTYLVGQDNAKEENDQDALFSFQYMIQDIRTGRTLGNLQKSKLADNGYIFVTKYNVAENQWTFDKEYDCQSYEHYMKNMQDSLATLSDNYEITLAIDKDVLNNSQFANMSDNYSFFQTWQKPLLYGSIVLALIICGLFLFFMIRCGRKEEGKSLEYACDHIYMELKIGAAILIVFLWVFGMSWVFYLLNSSSSPIFRFPMLLGYNNKVPIYDDVNFTIILGTAFLSAILVMIFLAILLSIIRTFKARRVGENLFVWHYGTLVVKKCFGVIKSIGLGIKNAIISIYHSRGEAGRTGLIYLGYLAINIGMVILLIFFLVVLNAPVLAFILIVVGVVLHICVAAVIMKDAKGIDTIKKAAQLLAEGEIEAKVPMDGLVGGKRELAKTVNRIGDGLYEAVEQSIKDERLKAELITNVSHDIKTPLTSIINYVDLLKREKIDNKKAKEYLEILDQKSQRLKQLTLDLVEASKASTGNVELELMPLNMKELMNQVTGEFADKFEAKNLQLVENITEDFLVITGDNKYTYRIFENLFQNIYKYSMPSSRVYLDLSRQEDLIQVCIRNMSNAPLTRSVEELTERFTRGEQSRTTEGSGLGLSIAKDLTKLQGGTMDIILDGDLFKVVLSFPQTDTMIG